MNAIAFPAEWGSLKHPYVRWELLAELRELSDPLQTSRWLTSDPTGTSAGIAETVHFFFDDHAFDQADIGFCFFDEEEVRFIQRLVEAMEQVIGPGRTLLSNRDALAHQTWPKVECAALAALEHLRTRGVPTFEETIK